MSNGLSTEGSDAINAPALAGGKGDAEMGAQVCLLPPHTAYALCGQCGSARETSPLLSPRIPSASQGLRGGAALATPRAPRRT